MYLWIRVGHGLDPSMDWIGLVFVWKMDPCPTLVWTKHRIEKNCIKLGILRILR